RLVVLAENFDQHTASVVHKIAKTLRDEYAVYFAGRWLLHIVQIIVGKRFLEWNFDGDVGLIIIWNYFERHNNVLHYTRSFRIGAAGKNCERAIELFGKHDAGESVGIGHGTERKLLRNPFT